MQQTPDNPPDPERIYPPEVDAGTPYRSTLTSDESQVRSSAWWQDILLELIRFISGLITIASIAALLAFAMGIGLFSHTGEYFGALQDAISIMIVWPVLLTIFCVISIIRKDWVFILYPLIVFVVLGQIVYGLVATDVIATYLPFQLGGARTTNQLFATGVLSYALVYSLEHTVSRVIGRGRFRRVPKNLTTTLVTLAATTASIGVVILMQFVGSDLIHHKQAESVRLRLPQSDQITVSLVGDTSFALTYPNISSDADSYDKLDITVRTPDTPTTTDCASVPSAKRSNISGVEVYEQDTSDVLAGPSSKAHTFALHILCFEIDNASYVITRNASIGSSHITQFPTRALVARFVDTKATKFCTTVSSFCTPEEVMQSQTLYPTNTRSFYGTRTDTTPVNPNAYEPTRWLAVPAWDIQMPLTKEIENLYLIQPTQDEKLGYFGQIGVDDALCYAGTKNNQKGTGIGYITRANTYTSGVLTGKTLTSNEVRLTANGVSKDCLTTERIAEIQDVFDWVQASIKPL